MKMLLQICYLLLYNLVFNSRMLLVCPKPRTYNFFQSYFAVLEIGNYFLGYYVDGLHGGPLVLSVSLYVLSSDESEPGWPEP